MSKLDNLIAKLCPNGVVYKKVGEVCQTITDYTAAGSFGDIAKNVKYINNRIGFAQLIRTTDLKSDFDNPDKFVYVDEKAYKYLWRVNLNSEGLVMPNVGNCGEVYYITPESLPHENNVLGPNAIWVRSNTVLIRYLFHLFLAKEFQNKLAKIISPTGQTKFNKTNFKELTIPVPPLEVQREIVRVLDNFTLLTAELTAELTARRKQYEYYADALFPSLKDSDVDWVDVGEIATVTKLAGFEFTKYVTYSKTGKIIALRGLNVKNGHLILDDVKYVDNSELSMLSRSKLKIDDMLFTYVGTVGQVAIIEENDKYYLAPNVALVRINDNSFLSKYMMYYFLTKKFKNEQILKLLQASSMQNIPMEKIRKFKLPCISVTEQNRVVSILDKFDGLTNDISIGIPAEITARQKQYEYYRDKLLTFKEAR